MPARLCERKCQPLPPGAPALTDAQINLLLPEVPNWSIVNNVLHRTFKFKNYYEALAFVNATAFISHREDHHPDIDLGYNKVTMRYSTHSVGGLSENDFICAAKINQLLPSLTND
ncbi:MAG: 4a-hydroxytetrahydrobiopterin dehydratase [Phycisphaerae bacterium]